MLFAFSVEAEAGSLNDTYYTLQRRGISCGIINNLWECDLLHRVCIIAHTTDIKPIRLPSFVIQTPIIQGGLGATRPGTYIETKMCLKSMPTLKMKDLKDLLCIMRNVTNQNNEEKNIPRTLMCLSFGYFARHSLCGQWSNSNEC